MPDQREEHTGSLLDYSQQSLSHGLSDHVMVHLIPSYRQKLKLCKPVARTLKQWTSEAAEDLQVCLDSTDWDVFRTATESLDEYIEAVTLYILP